MCIIQSNFGTQGNFEVVVLEGGQPVHYWRANDDSVHPWSRGRSFGSGATGAPALIQSNFGSKGNFEVVVREGSQLRHYWRDNDETTLSWHQGALFGNNVASDPCLIQSNFYGSDCQHGSRETHNCEWHESKCGPQERILHDKYQMQGGDYGNIIKYCEKADTNANLDLP